MKESYQKLINGVIVRRLHGYRQTYGPPVHGCEICLAHHFWWNSDEDGEKLIHPIYELMLVRYGN